MSLAHGNKPNTGSVPKSSSPKTIVNAEKVPDEKVESKKSKRASKKSTKKSLDPAKITPEYIEEQRRLRNIRKTEKEKELKEKGIEIHQEGNSNLFIKRPLLEIPSIENGTTGTENPPRLDLKIMTYNVLAQALIRRKLFPTNGAALKWGVRSKTLLAEFKYYDADVMCLQELDYVQYNSFWKKEFENVGYISKYYRSNAKNHGLAIVFKEKIFTCKHQSFINYDDERVSEETLQLPVPRTITQNVGFICYLTFQPSVIERYPYLAKKNGLIIGTTHLFWHPFGTFERTRQTFLILHKFRQFTKTLETVIGNSKGFYQFFAGDMNSQPFDSPYLAITAKPVCFTGRASTVISCSLSYQYSKNRGLVDGSEEREEGEEEEGGNIEKFGKDQPRDPCPDDYTATSKQLDLVKQLEVAHNSLGKRAISLYSLGYRSVHPENSGQDNDRNEPYFSNWASTWRGLLDYIFVISDWSKDHDFSKDVDTLQDLQKEQGIKLTGLLKLPLPQDMGPEPSGQPRLGQYPSDHLCLMAKVQLL